MALNVNVGWALETPATLGNCKRIMEFLVRDSVEITFDKFPYEEQP